MQNASSAVAIITTVRFSFFSENIEDYSFRLPFMIYASLENHGVWQYTFREITIKFHNGCPKNSV